MRVFSFVFSIFSVFSSVGQKTTSDSLLLELKLADADTSQVNVLIDLVYATEDLGQALEYAQQAYLIGQESSSIRHKSRSELVLGSYYADQDLDSGVLLMNKATERYHENKMHRYTSNGLYITALTYQSYNKLDSAYAVFERCYQIASENDLHSDAGNAAYYMASILSLRGNTLDGLKWSKKAIEHFHQGGMLQEKSEAINQVAVIYDQKGLYSEAIDQYLKAKELAIESGDINGEILINNNLGVIFDNMGNAEKSMNYYSDALEKARIHGLVENEATILNNLSYIHAKRGDTAKALSLLHKSLKINFSEYYPCFESYPLEGIASIHLNRKEYDSAAYYLEKGLNIAEGCQDAVVMSTIKKGLGQLYSFQERYDQANANLKEALQIAEQSDLTLERKEILYALYESLKAQNKTALALTYLEKYQTYVESLNEQRNAERAIEIATAYEFRKEIAQMEEEQRKVEEGFAVELENQSSLNQLMLLALFLFVMLTGTMVMAYRFIKKKNVKLKWLNSEKNKLIGIVAHDLRNPLNMIMGLIPLFRDAVKDTHRDDLNQYVQLMEASSEKMKNMIERVLDISSIENMKVNLQMQRKDLSSIVTGCVNNFKMIAANKKIEIVVEDFSNQKFISKFDANYLEQVLDNLLSNAIKFSSSGKKVYIKVETSSNQNIIHVKDEGPGLAEKDQERLFDPYTTLSSKPTENERSSGLGLSIAQRFIHAMGGEITCESRLGKGTTFKVAFAKA